MDQLLPINEHHSRAPAHWPEIEGEAAKSAVQKAGADFLPSRLLLKLKAMKRTERDDMISFIKGYDSFYDCYNFDLYSDEDLRELKGYIEEMIRSRYRFR